MYSCLCLEDVHQQPVIKQNNQNHCFSRSILTLDNPNSPDQYISLRFLTFDDTKQPKPLYFLEIPDF